MPNIQRQIQKFEKDVGDIPSNLESKLLNYIDKNHKLSYLVRTRGLQHEDIQSCINVNACPNITDYTSRPLTDNNNVNLDLSQKGWGYGSMLAGMSIATLGILYARNVVRETQERVLRGRQTMLTSISPPPRRDIEEISSPEEYRSPQDRGTTARGIYAPPDSMEDRVLFLDPPARNPNVESLIARGYEGAERENREYDKWEGFGKIVGMEI